ncbi:hypothetical protein JVU11DRAFT_8841 [Chiua virens]|nr:hypothetical protein JVU11DRAFT_8841 [Chiua virens]
MAPIGKLYSVPHMRQTKIIRSVAALGSLELEIVADYKHFEDNKKPDFLAKFPHGKIPAFEGSNGFNLTEGAAIARYLATHSPNANLGGSTLEEQALIEQWCHFAESEIDNPTLTTGQMLRGILIYNKAIHTTLIERQARALNTLNAHLLTPSLPPSSVPSASHLTQRPVRKLVNTIRHLETIILQYVPPKKEPRVAPPAPAPKEKKEKPKEEEVDDDDEKLVPEEPKAKNPLELLPKSTFNLEDWKRAYSNKDTRGPDGALEWFYANFDKEGFSVWRADFKYNDELTLIFMSSNQIGGFFNRLEASRKYLFGSMGVLGEPNASVISGVLILRGQEVKAAVDCAPDWESYDYKKLDLGNEDDKKFFESALAWDLEIDGKAWKDGKNFK